MKQELSHRLINELGNFDTISGIELQKSLVQWLDEEVSYYNWTGFYFMNDEKHGASHLPHRSPHQKHR